MTAATDRERIALDEGWLAFLPYVRPARRDEVALPPLRGRHRPGHHEGMVPLSYFGVYVERKRVDIDPWVWITLAAVVVPVLLATLAVLFHMAGVA